MRIETTKKLTPSELLDKLSELEFNPRAYNDEDYDENAIKDAVGDFDEAAQFGGSGKGDDYWKVLYFKDHDIYLRADGTYTSYEGSDMDGSEWYEVKRKEKTIIVYEK